MATHTTPPIVTRFYRNLDFALDVIANRQVAFVHVDTLNDPFDPYFVLETDFAESHSELIRYVQRFHPGDDIWFNQLMPAENWQDAINGIRERMAYVRNTTFVFSASSELEGARPRDSLYMWGHYADGHRGVALEFDTRVLASSVMRHSRNSTGEITNPWVRMEYRPSVPPLTAEIYYQFLKQEYAFASGVQAIRVRTALEDYYDLMPRVKGEAWHSENEWRLMWRNDETRMKFCRFPISQDAIRTIILGLRMSDKSKSDFIVEARQNFPEATVLHARKRRGDFALMFEQA